MIFDILMSTLRLSVPILFAAYGGMLSERSGIANIALEANLLFSAFAAASVAALVGNLWLGALAGILTSGGVAALFAAVCIWGRGDQIVVGTAFNLLAYGLIPVICKALFNVTGSTPALGMLERFEVAPMFLAAGLVLAAQLFLKKTSGGLWLSFAGEHPQALDAAGVRVNRVRWAAVLVSGFLAGIGGSCLSIFLSSGYSRNMTAGRGFMALAALILGKWRPVPAALACLLFGLTEAAQTRLQGVVLWGTEPVPVQFIQILPYLVTVIVLAGWIGESKPPKQLGVAYRSG